MLKLHVFGLLIASLVSATAFGETPYTFGGSCASSGPWTTKALAQTQSIADTIDALRKFPDCNGFETLFQTIKANSINLAAAPGGMAEAARLESIPGRMTALESMENGAVGIGQSKILGALLKEKYNAAVMTADTATVKGGLLGLDRMASNNASTMNQALDMLDQLTSTTAALLPKFDGCLMNHAAQGAALVADLVDLTATFVSGNGTSPRVGRAINNILTMFRNRNFSTWMRTLDMGRFRNSLACIVEATAESYCSVEDAYHLLNAGVQSYHLSFNPNSPYGMSFANPLAGYYILTRHLPNISNWIQRVQYGVEPKWSTDADFKINAFNNVASFQTSQWKIIGKFNDDLKVYDKCGDNLSCKKNTLLIVLTNVVQGLGGGNAILDPQAINPNAVNFFTMTVQSALIPFYLIGRDKIPPDAVQNSLGGVALAWDQWMKGDGSFSKAPEFNNPDQLVNTIRTRLNDLIEKAGQTASDFYQQRIIVNQGILVSEALVDSRYSVRESFQFIYDYLNNLDNMFTSPDPKYHGDHEEQYLIGQLRSVRRHIRVVLDAFEKLQELNSIHPQSKQESDLIEEAYKTVTNTVYSEFDVMWQRDSYLSGSVTQLVFADYIYRIKHGIDLGPYERDLMISSGKDLIDLLTQVNGLNPSSVKADLDRAQTLNYETNLPAVEMAFGDPMRSTIQELNVIINKGDVSNTGLDKTYLKNLWHDTVVNGQARRDNPGTMTLSQWFFSLPGMLASRLTLRPDLYPLRFNPQRMIRQTQDNDNHTLASFRDQLCILSLAFVHRDDFRNLCHGVVLKSVYPNSSADFYLNASYDKILNAKRDKNYLQNAICAFRNYHRRNLVFWLTENLQNGQ